MTLNEDEKNTPILKALENILQAGATYKIHELTVMLKNEGAFPEDLPKDALLSLFHQQFLVMNGLFRLQDSLEAKGYWLTIEPLCICINPKSLDTPNKKKDVLGPVEYLKAYYLDPSHLLEATPDTVADLLSGFWQRFHRLDEKSEALAVLGLEEGADLTAVKQRYQQRVHEVHPDKGGDAETFRQVQQAYQVLKACY